MLESLFIEPHHSKDNVTNIYSVQRLMVNIDLTGIRSQQPFDIYLEKFRQILQIRLCDANDLTKMYISTIDHIGYEQCKVDQSLHVSFDGFLEHLVRIFDSCQRGELHVALNRDHSGQQLKFYEQRQFRNLQHLNLPIKDAPQNIIMFHLNQNLIKLQNEKTSYKTQCQRYQQDIECRDNRILDLNREQQILQQKLNEQEGLVFSRNTEHISKLQQEIKHLNESKELEVKRLNTIIRSNQEQIEQLKRDQFTCQERLAHETKRAILQSDELTTMKQNLNATNDHNIKLEQEIDALKAYDRKTDNLCGRQRKEIQELQQKLRHVDKEKCDIAATLEAEKNICQIKRKALEIVTEELETANTLSFRQANEIKTLKKKNASRMELAQAQEKIIEQKNRDLEDLQAKLQHFVPGNKDEILLQIKDIDDCVKQVEIKYKKQIETMKNRIDELNAQIKLNKTKNQYLRLTNRME